MSANSRMTIAVHVLTWMSLDRQNNEVATSDRIAGSVNTNPVVIRRCLGDLRKAGLVQAKRGVGAGWVLTREPEETSLLEVYLAVEGGGPFGMHHTPPNPDCPIGFGIRPPCSRCTADWRSRCSKSWLAPRSLTCCGMSSLSRDRSPTPAKPPTSVTPVGPANSRIGAPRGHARPQSAYAGARLGFPAERFAWAAVALSRDAVRLCPANGSVPYSVVTLAEGAGAEQGLCRAPLS